MSEDRKNALLSGQVTPEGDDAELLLRVALEARRLAAKESQAAQEERMERMGLQNERNRLKAELREAKKGTLVEPAAKPGAGRAPAASSRAMKATSDALAAKEVVERERDAAVAMAEGYERQVIDMEKIIDGLQDVIETEKSRYMRLQADVRAEYQGRMVDLEEKLKASEKARAELMRRTADTALQDKVVGLEALVDRLTEENKALRTAQVAARDITVPAAEHPAALLPRSEQRIREDIRKLRVTVERMEEKLTGEKAKRAAAQRQLVRMGRQLPLDARAASHIQRVREALN